MDEIIRDGMISNELYMKQQDAREAYRGLTYTRKLVQASIWNDVMVDFAIRYKNEKHEDEDKE